MLGDLERERKRKTQREKKRALKKTPISFLSPSSSFLHPSVSSSGLCLELKNLQIRVGKVKEIP